MESLPRQVRSLTGVSLGARQVRALQQYAAELAEWNRRANLTAIVDREGIQTKHFLDSLSCLMLVKPSAGSRLVDIGTGAGFPGLPLKIALPRLRLTLIEATGKKAGFCRYIVDRLQLQDVEVLHTRAEQAGQDPAYRERFDWALARAVAALPVLGEYLLPFVKVGGYALAQKGETGPEEAHAAGEALCLLGGEVEKIVPVDLPGVTETRYLILIAKKATTPAKYPRRAGMPSKRPLGKKNQEKDVGG